MEEKGGSKGMLGNYCKQRCPRTCLIKMAATEKSYGYGRDNTVHQVEKKHEKTAVCETLYRQVLFN